MTLTDEELARAIAGAEMALRALREERQAREVAMAESLLTEFTAKVHQHFGRPLDVRVGTSKYDYDVFYEIDIPSSFDFDVASSLDGTFLDDAELHDKFLRGGVFYSLRFVK